MSEHDELEALGDSTRAGLQKVLDLLFPGTQTLPSARSAGVHLECLDRALHANPRILETMRRVGDSAASQDAAELADLEKWAQDQTEGVVFTLTAAYYMSPRVLEALGYPGQVRRPVSQATPEERYSEDLLAPVRERGAIYIPTPVLDGPA